MRSIFGLFAALAALAAGAAAAQESPPAPVRQRPNIDLSDVYPQRAADEGVGGRVILSCTIKADGGLRDCVVKSETPTGYGFGEAGLRTTGKFKMRTKTAEGASTEGETVQIPLSFVPPGA